MQAKTETKKFFFAYSQKKAVELLQALIKIFTLLLITICKIYFDPYILSYF